MTPETQQIFADIIDEVNTKHESEAFNKGKKEGKKEGIEEIAKKLKTIHTPEEIAKITGLKIETIQQL